MHLTYSLLEKFQEQKIFQTENLKLNCIKYGKIQTNEKKITQNIYFSKGNKLKKHKSHFFFAHYKKNIYFCKI